MVERVVDGRGKERFRLMIPTSFGVDLDRVDSIWWYWTGLA